MRLIDADALDREMYRKSFETDDGRQHWHSGLWIRYKIFEETLRDAPTVDAVPVRYGRWEIPEGHPDARICTQCGMICHADRAMLYRYCPNCGAKMERDEEWQGEK